ncbi:hypothetical protein A2U01_0073854, partial [Trifolium medium]|nr:hypothetical protein [Trifolium medium]
MMRSVPRDNRGGDAAPPVVDRLNDGFSGVSQLW